MCGIMGRITTKPNDQIMRETLAGLKKLEYRGYDSAGMVVFTPEPKIVKVTGKVSVLAAEVLDESGILALAHTRWATHGVVSAANTHPHYSSSQRFYLVHNGTIENYQLLKAKYCQNVELYGQTDSEVLVNVLAYFMEVDGMFMHEAFRRLMREVEGSYAIVVVDRLNPHRCMIAKNKTPFVIGRNATGFYVASDLMAMAEYAKTWFALPDRTYAEIGGNYAACWDSSGVQQLIAFRPCEEEQEVANKGEYAHFMLKEIEEQPQVLRNLVQTYVKSGQYLFDDAILEALKGARQIHLIAAGTSYFASLTIAQLFLTEAQREVRVALASEFVYAKQTITSEDVYVFISQSGQTADTLAALDKVKRAGALTIGVSNTEFSQLSIETDHIIYLQAGREIAVASTKAYTAQVGLFLGLILAMESADASHYEHMILQNIGAIDSVLQMQQNIADLAQHYLVKHAHAYYIGRQIGYVCALEAALKLKEIAYIHAEGFAGGELKHGTMALIEDQTPVIAFITDAITAPLMRSNIEEVRARGAAVLVIAVEHCSVATDQIIIPSTNELSSLLGLIIPAQLLAYYSALLKGCDVDMPRNLAKSVTVE